jgi:hypothetical protein
MILSLLSHEPPNLSDANGVRAAWRLLAHPPRLSPPVADLLLGVSSRYPKIET